MALNLNLTLGNATPFNAEMQQGLINALAHVTGSSGVSTNVTGFSTNSGSNNVRPALCFLEAQASVTHRWCTNMLAMELRRPEHLHRGTMLLLSHPAFSWHFSD